jgi:maltooligosyltrehalose trehalohydrolase
MPYGAQITSQGVRFRLWAPDCEQVALCLAEGHNERVLPMGTCGGGWFVLTVPRTGAGTRYRYQVKDGLRVPDPASRFNPDDVHGASEVIDPAGFHWQDAAWCGRPWEEAVIYELHVVLAWRNFRRGNGTPGLSGGIGRDSSRTDAGGGFSG